MKTILPSLLLCLLLSEGIVRAQNCAPTGLYNFSVNNIRARLNMGGDLFSFSGFSYLPAENTPATIFSSTFWIGGIKNGELVFSGSNYGFDGVGARADFRPGPLLPGTGEPLPGCAFWNTFFRVTREEIASFEVARTQLSAMELMQLYPNIMGWPGARNPFFNLVHHVSLPEEITVLAPFYDADADGYYNPLGGDLPMPDYRYLERHFIPDEFAWAVMNDFIPGSGDSTATVGVQLEVMAWGFDCESSPVLKDVVFTNHRVRYFGSEPIDSCYVGIFTDIDLGCRVDDRIGTAPEQNTLFAYNADAFDGDEGYGCSGDTPFTGPPPVQTITFLDDLGMEKGAAWNYNYNANTFYVETGVPLGAHRFMTGRWADGLPFTQGGDGYNPGSTDVVDFLFPGDPSDPEGLSMCTGSYPMDPRLMGSRRIEDAGPGFVHELVTAWMVTPDAPAPCSIGNALDRVQEVRDLFDNDFQEGCGSFVGLSSDLVVNENLRLYPNPATHTATLELEEAAEVRVLAIDGRVLFAQRYPAGRQELNLRGLPAGGYWVQAIGDAGVSARRLVVAR